MCFVAVRAAKMLFYSKIWQIWSEDIALAKKSESILRKYNLKFVAKSISPGRTNLYWKLSFVFSNIPFLSDNFLKYCKFILHISSEVLLIFSATPYL